MGDLKEMSIKELKAEIIAFIGEAGLRSKNFVEKYQLIDFLVEQKALAEAKKSGIFVVPAGKYILGDPCFAATDVLDLEMFNETYYESDKEEDEESGSENTKKKAQTVKSKAKSKGKSKEGDAPDIDECRIARFNANTVVTAFNTYDTECGSSWYTDTTKQLSFLINGGVVALVPFEYNTGFAFNPPLEDGVQVAHIVEFDVPARCSGDADTGTLQFGHIVINTRRSRAPPVPEGGRAKKAAGKRRKKADKYESEEEEEEEGSEEEEEEEEEEAEDYSTGSDTDSGDDDDDEEFEPEPAKKKLRRGAEEQ